MISFDIDDEFEAFMRKANPLVRESSAQYKESRRVFVAGVAATYSFLLNELTPLPEEQAMKELEKISDQLKAFRKRIGFNL